jgi:hypothetical protein
MQIFKELKKLYVNPSNLDEEYTLFDECIDPITHKWKPPENKYDGRRPNIACFIDDAQSTAIFRNKAFINMALKHRHLGSMPAMNPVLAYRFSSPHRAIRVRGEPYRVVLEITRIA